MTNKSRRKKSIKAEENIDTETLKKIISGEIVSLHQRIRSGRIRKPKNEMIRIQNLRALCSLCKLHLDICDSQKLDSVQNELEELREVIDELEDGDDHE